LSRQLGLAVARQADVLDEADLAAADLDQVALDHLGGRLEAHADLVVLGAAEQQEARDDEGDDPAPRRPARRPIQLNPFSPFFSAMRVSAVTVRQKGDRTRH
jgi:hypothetical protein